MGLFSWLRWVFGDKTKILGEQSKQVIKNMWVAMFADSPERKDEIAIEFLTNMTLDMKNSQMYRQMGKVLDYMLNDVVQDEFLKTQFLDHFYGRAVDLGYMSVADAKVAYARSLNLMQSLKRDEIYRKLN